jgi:hypothetical protein
MDSAVVVTGAQWCTEMNVQGSGRSLVLDTLVCVMRLRTTSMNLEMAVIRDKIEGGTSWIKQGSWYYMILIQEGTTYMCWCSNSCNYLKLGEDLEWGAGMSNVAASGARVQRAEKLAVKWLLEKKTFAFLNCLNFKLLSHKRENSINVISLNLLGQPLSILTLDSKKPGYATDYSPWAPKRLATLLNTLPGYQKT